MTYERVVVSVKSTGPDPKRHTPVEIAWWGLATGDRGCFVPHHNVHAALNTCHVDTIRALGYLDRLAQAEQDENGHEAHRLAEALHNAVLVSITPLVDDQWLRQVFSHYADLDLCYEPEWLSILDVRSLALGVLGLDVLPDLAIMCERTAVPLEAAHTAETDADAIGKVVLRLTEMDGWATRPPLGRLNGVPSTVELSAAFTGRLDKVNQVDALVQFGHDGERQTYLVDYSAIAAAAAATYMPVVDALWDEGAEIQAQFAELGEKTTKVAQEWQARCDRLQAELNKANEVLLTPVKDVDLRAELTEVLHTRRGHCEMQASQCATCGIDADHAAKLYATALGAKDVQIAERDKEIEQLRTDLAAKQASREAWATEAMDLELAKDTPWAPIELPVGSLPVTELSIGPATAPPVPAGQPADGVWPAEVAPEFDVGVPDVAATSPEPVLAICPAPYDCGHPLVAHDLKAGHNPIPTCTGDLTEPCRCGLPPAGWSRVHGERVWRNGDTVPAGVCVLALDGSVYGPGLTGEWVNESLGPVVEVHKTPSPAPADQSADQPPASQPAREVAGATTP